MGPNTLGQSLGDLKGTTSSTTIPRHDPWDCHIYRSVGVVWGVNVYRHIWHTWSVWDMCMIVYGLLWTSFGMAVPAANVRVEKHGRKVWA